MNESEYAAHVTLGVMDRAAELFSKSLDVARKKIAVGLRSGFKEFKKSSTERYSNVRTLMHRDKPIPLTDLYVSTSFNNSGNSIQDTDIIIKSTKPCKILIQGTAGGGKSIFLRMLNHIIFKSNTSVIPVLFELKSLNSSQLSIIGAAVGLVSPHMPDIDEVAFLQLLDSGKLVLILDGFDEIDYGHRDRYAKEIALLCRNHDQSSIIVSSRPDDMVSSVEPFSVYTVVPFTKEQALALIGKLPYNPPVKAKFQKDVEAELYEKHRGFLSNPLLITMMLITYDQFAEIPSKIHIFYQQAFETLFRWHDASKEVFKRQSYTDLPMDDFQKIFELFCISTYNNQIFSFRREVVIEEIKAALRAHGASVSAENYLRDLEQSTCLLQKDGLDYVFVHRSFQEYFSAMFICRQSAVDCRRIINKVILRAYADLVLPMSYEINQHLIELAWVLPSINALIKKFDGIDPKSEPVTFFSKFFQSIDISEPRTSLTYIPRNTTSSKLIALRKLFPRTEAVYPEKEAAAYARKFISALKLKPDDFEYFSKFSEDNLELSLLADSPDITLSLKGMDNRIDKYINLSKWSSAESDHLFKRKLEVEKRLQDRRGYLSNIAR